MKPELIAEGKRLCEAATPIDNAKLSRYDHGGGRYAVFDGDERVLIADFYNEGDRELFYFLRNNATALLSAAERCGELERAIEDEPELPGDMPDEMWEAVQEADRETMTEILRACVRTTKAGILRATLRHDGERGETTPNPPRWEQKGAEDGE